MTDIQENYLEILGVKGLTLAHKVCLLRNVEITYETR